MDVSRLLDLIVPLVLDADKLRLDKIEFGWAEGPIGDVAGDEPKLRVLLFRTNPGSFVCSAPVVFYFKLKVKIE